MIMDFNFLVITLFTQYFTVHFTRPTKSEITSSYTIPCKNTIRKLKKRQGSKRIRLISSSFIFISTNSKIK